MTKYIEAAREATIIAEKHGIPLGDLVDTFAEIPLLMLWKRLDAGSAMPIRLWTIISGNAYS